MGSGRFRRDERGGVAIMAAAGGALFCAVAAVAVDLAAIAMDGRALQGAADLAALSAVLDVGRAERGARATAEANLEAVTTQVIVGRYVADPALAPEARFMAGGPNPNAVRVTLNRPTSLMFGRVITGRQHLMQSRTATAARPSDPPLAMFSLGSRLLRLDGGVANSLLSGLTGSTVSLSVMDYNRLADARVNLLQFSDALATDLGLRVGDYDALLRHEVDAGRALQVLQALAGDQGDSALSKLTRPATGVTVRMGELIGVEAEAGEGIATGLDASVSVLDLVMTLLETGGERQARLALGAQAGIASLDTFLAIGERPNNAPWLTVTGKGAPIIRTAQARLYVKARTAQSVSGLAQVNLPILLELASSEARLDRIDCNSGSVDLGVRPGLAIARIGEIDESRLNDFKRSLSVEPATLLSVLGLVRLTGKAEVEIADTGFRSVRFTSSDIATQKVRTVTSSSLATGLIASLVQRLDVTVDVVGLGLGLGGIVQAMGALLAPLGPVLDAALNPLLELLGLHLGEADVRVHGLSCPGTDRSRPVLVG